MANIGIIGAGLAGLHIGLYLQQHGLSPTIYTDRSPDEIRRGRLLNTVALGWPARDRDEALGVRYWDLPENVIRRMHIYVVGEQPLRIAGKWTEGPGVNFIDMRAYLARLMVEFTARGGRLEQRAVTIDQVAALADGHDLVVVATGRDGLANLFERIAEESPYARPQRYLWSGLVRGVAFAEPPTLTYHILPEAGEWLDISPFVTERGRASALFLEATVGGPLEPLARMRYGDDPGAFDRALLEACMEYLPGTRDRIDADAFRVLAPLDQVAGTVTSTVRRGFRRLDNGRCVLAVGDAHAVPDPVAGQGGNMAVKAAWLVSEMIVERVRAGQALDEDFCVRAAQRQWRAVAASIYMSNAMLMPPPAHVQHLLGAASQHQAVADAFIHGFIDPERGWHVLSSPENTQAFLDELMGA